MLTAFYDLRYSPASYDAVGAALQIEVERQRLGEDEVEVRIAPGPSGGFRSDRFWPKDLETRRTLLAAVVVPMFRMLPRCRDVIVEDGRQLTDRGKFGFGRSYYGMRRIVDGIAMVGRPLRRKAGATRDANLVTITLRECSHWSQRNSDVTEWIAAARVIRDRGFHVVFVRDTRHADKPIEDFSTDAPAARDLDLRAFLYSASRCNMFVSNGPAWFSMALDAPTVIMKPTTEKIGACYTASFFASCGIPAGGQLPNSPSHQRIAWREDSASAIVEEFDSFIRENPR